MTPVAAAATPAQAPQRSPLNRRRVLEAALALVDADGLDALSMRRLGAELGVEAMSVYKHVANKDALLDGIVELLWTEVHDRVAEGTDWAGRLRSFADAVRAMMHRHPQPAPLLLSRCVLPPQLLETYATLLDAFRDAGLDQAVAAQAVRSLCSYAMGYGITELYCFGAWRTDPRYQPADTTRADTVNIALWLGRNLPPGTPPRLVDAAVSMLDCNPYRDFQAGLDMAIQGLRQLQRTAPSPSR